jgi:hypothetical protein
LRGEALDTPTVNVVQGYIAPFSASSLPKTKSLGRRPRKVRESRFEGHRQLGIVERRENRGANEMCYGRGSPLEQVSDYQITVFSGDLAGA